MKIETRFKTREAAIAYLVKRGWQVLGTNYVGDIELVNLRMAGTKRRIIKLITGKWRIDAA